MVGVCTAGLATAADPSNENSRFDSGAQGKVTAALAKRFVQTGTADFVVRFSDQVDLSPAYGMSWEERGQFVYDTLREAAEQSQATAIRRLRSARLEFRSFIAGNELYVIGGDASTAAGLAELSEVESLRVPHTYLRAPVTQHKSTVKTVESNLADMGATDFWDEFGARGEGIKVATIGGGAYPLHPALHASYGCGSDYGDPKCWFDPAATCGSVCDLDGHGTHVLGIIVGDDRGANQIGVAPGATWIACKGCDSSACTEMTLNACADWILAPDGNPSNRPHVVNNAWGYAGCSADFLPKVNAWRAAGIFPAFGAGNSGPGCSSLGSPGDYQESFATTAHDGSGTIAPWASRGPSCFGHDPHTKPNVSAPGMNIRSAWNDGGYATQSGTSMSSPHSAGAVALLWSCNPALIGNIVQTFEILQDSAAATPSGPCGAPPDAEGNYTYGYGYLDVHQAGLLWCSSLSRGWLQGTVRDRDTSLPLTGTTVRAFPGTGGTTTDGTGSYSLTLPPGTFDVTAALDGYTRETVPGVDVLGGTITTQNMSLKESPVWTAGPPDPGDFYRHDCAWFDDGTGMSIYNQKVYCLGGRVDSGIESGDIWRFDPRTGVWSDTGHDIPISVSNYTATVIEDGNSPTQGPAIYVVSGYDAETGSSVTFIQRYYPKTGSASVVTTDPWPLTIGGAVGHPGGCASVQNRIYCFGGMASSTAPYVSDETWEYDPARSAGSRWQRILSADLGRPRGYIQVAVQQDVIYALGGHDFVPSPVDLVPTVVVEALDVNDLASGWVARAPMPMASAEGRGFGMDEDGDYSGSSYQLGRIFIAGGGDWPDQTAEAMEYDIATDTWNQAFPDLITARRNHAGAYVPLCTADPDDGLPGLWVFGGRTTSDLPPFGEPEFFPFPCEVSIFADGFEAGDTTAWSSTVP
jgi:subtilisin family serine protease